MAINTKPSIAGSSSGTSSGSSEKPFAPIWMQWIATVVAVVMVFTIGLSIFWFLANLKLAPPRNEPKQTVLRVAAFEIEAVPLKRFIASFGTARADVEVTVSAEVSGRVTEKGEWEIGTSVSGPKITTLASGESSRKQGDVLVQIDPQTYQERVSQVESLIEQDRVNLNRLMKQEVLNERLLTQQRERLKTITSEYERTLELFQQGAENESAVRQKKLELEQYRETLIRLENEEELLPIQREELQTQQRTHLSDLKLAQLELEKATVRAPASGTLSEVFVEQGQFVHVGDPIVQITSSDRVEVPISITLEDAVILSRMIEEGKFPSAQLAAQEKDVLAQDSLTWKGHIERIDPVADTQTRTVLAFVEVNNSEQKQPLRPGTFVFARIESGLINAENGVLIPREALVDGSVYLVSEGETKPNREGKSETALVAKRREVVISKNYQAFALISEGLSANDEIVTTNLDIIAENSLLDVRTVRSLEDELKRLKIPYLQKLQSNEEF